MSQLQSVTDETFQAEVLDSPIPVLVDFWAVWCGPCKAIAPTLETLAAKFAGRVKVVKIDIDENERTSEKFGILSIPTLYLFKGGSKVTSIVGAQPAARIEAEISKFI